MKKTFAALTVLLMIAVAASALFYAEGNNASAAKVPAVSAPDIENPLSHIVTASIAESQSVIPGHTLYDLTITNISARPIAAVFIARILAIEEGGPAGVIHGTGGTTHTRLVNIEPEYFMPGDVEVIPEVVTLGDPLAFRVTAVLYDDGTTEGTEFERERLSDEDRKSRDMASLVLHTATKASNLADFRRALASYTDSRHGPVVQGIAMSALRIAESDKDFARTRARLVAAAKRRAR